MIFDLKTGKIDMRKMATHVKNGDVITQRLDDMMLYTYSRQLQFADNWTPETLHARGLIVRDDGELVALPFEKFFNWMQGGRRAPWSAHIVNITKKMDGSLGILYRHKGEAAIATRGSFASDQAVWATNWMPDRWQPILMKELYDLTLLFEIIYPDNRIVVDYEGYEGLVLLAARRRTTGEYVNYYPDLYEISQMLQCDIAETVDFNNITQIIEATGKIDWNEEGWVVLFSNGERFKFKGDRYVEYHRLLSHFTPKQIYERWANGDHSWGENLPDEFHSAYQDSMQALDNEYAEWENRLLALYERLAVPDRKTFALQVKQNAPQELWGALFKMYDDKPYQNILVSLVGRQEVGLSFLTSMR